jgi:hypothetical protein
MVAGAQTKQNIQTALANARLGAVNQVTPYGTVNYTFGAPTGPAPRGAGGGGGGGQQWPQARPPY